MYSLSNKAFDLVLMAVFAALGYLLAKLECEAALAMLGFILAPMMEENLRREMLLSRGDPTTFLQKPISAAFIAPRR